MHPSEPVEHVNPPGEDVTVYDVTAEPFAAAADQDNATLAFPATALLNAGAPGSVAGTADNAFEAGPVPTELVAVTEKE